MRGVESERSASGAEENMIVGEKGVVARSRLGREGDCPAMALLRIKFADAGWVCLGGVCPPRPGGGDDRTREREQENMRKE